MSKARLFLIFLICSAAWSGCATQYSSETTRFQRYLRETFRQELPAQKAVYVLLPSTQCEACGQKLGNDLRAPGFPVTIIAGFKVHNSSAPVLTDYSGAMNRLPFVNYSNKMILVEGGQIRRIEAYADTTDLKRFYGE